MTDGNEVPFAFTVGHWILDFLLVIIEHIMVSIIMIYHLYNVYKHEIANKSNKRNFLYKLTTILSITCMLFYFLSMSTGWILVFGACGNIESWACLTYQISKGLMYIIFLIRLHVVYGESAYQYNPKLLISWSIFIIITQISSGIYGSLTYVQVSYTVRVLGRYWTSCATTMTIEYFMMLVSLDAFNTIALLIAFIIPFCKVMRSLTTNNRSKTAKSKRAAVKLTSLTLIALLSSLLAHPVSGFTQSTFIYLVDIPLNILCIMMTAHYYKRLYEKLCCGVIRCFECCDKSEQDEVGGMESIKIEQKQLQIAQQNDTSASE